MWEGHWGKSIGESNMEEAEPERGNKRGKRKKDVGNLKKKQLDQTGRK